MSGEEKETAVSTLIRDTTKRRRKGKTDEEAMLEVITLLKPLTKARRERVVAAALAALKALGGGDGE